MAALASALASVPLRASRGLLPQPAQVLARPAAALPPRRSRAACSAAARPEDEIEPVPPALLSALSSTDELTEEAAWLGSMVKCWANEEWAAAELFPVHEELGEATGQAYLRVRQQEGMSEMGDLVLGLATELMTCGFDFQPTFTSPFDVSNKCVELLMLRQGCDVCCTSDSDRTAIQRFEAQLAAERQQASG